MSFAIQNIQGLTHSQILEQFNGTHDDELDVNKPLTESEIEDAVRIFVSVNVTENLLIV